MQDWKVCKHDLHSLLAVPPSSIQDLRQSKLTRSWKTSLLLMVNCDFRQIISLLSFLLYNMGNKVYPSYQNGCKAQKDDVCGYTF